MTTLAEKFLNDWASEYEKTEGEVDRPNFKNIETNYTDEKEIPHYSFVDGSVIIEFGTNGNGIQWTHYDSVSELEEERDLEEGNEYSIKNVVSGY